MDRRSQAAPPDGTVIIALPAQTPRPAGAGAGATANRDDFWSDAATSALINAWGERHLLLTHGCLNHKQWQEVADTIPPKTPSQCQNRIDTLKRRYKAERSKTTPSSWPFFRRLHRLIAHPQKRRRSTSLSEFSLTNMHKRTRPQDHPAVTRKRSRMQEHPAVKRSGMQEHPAVTRKQEHPAVTRKRSGMQELAEAIVRFGQTYERVETTKLKQALEMEKHRTELALEIEVQRMQFFMKTQAEPSQTKRSNRKWTSDVTCKKNRSTNNRGSSSKWQSC